jgi:hypothetical protein
MRRHKLKSKERMEKMREKTGNRPEFRAKGKRHKKRRKGMA